MDVCVNFKGGGSFVKVRPVLSANGENVFFCSRNTISQYNTKTSKFIYEYKGLKENVIGVCYNYIDDFECLTACSANGQVIIWKIAFKEKLYEWDLKEADVRTFNFISFNSNKELECLISYNKYNKINFKIVNSKTGSRRDILKISDDNYMVDICQDKFFSVVQENVIYFVKIQNLFITKYKMGKNNRKFTCIACHPNEEAVLTGDDSGRILLWQDLFDKKTQAVFHWHTLPVDCLVFSSSGSNFYSGANECVLVKWQCDKPNVRQFLPRLPAGISHLSISDNNAYLAVATSDNAIRIVDSRLNQIALIQHLVIGNHFESGIIYDPITRSLVLNGNVGCVQFYSPNDMSLLYNVDIVNQTKITDERESQLENTEVRKVALSKSGKWLATVEDRRSEGVCNEIRLKFWQFNSAKQMFELNTSIEYPHEIGILNIAFQPLNKENNLKCVTIGVDKKFKIWQINEVQSVHKSGLVWKCLSEGYYRQLPCKSLSFSIDGSLFATAFGSILTTWTPDSCDLKCSLIHPKYKQDIDHVQFGQSDQCHLLVAAGKSQLTVWNILTLCMVWVVNIQNINLLVADYLSTYMMVISKENKVFVFEAANPTILYSSDKLINKSNEVVAAAFIPGKYSNDSRLQWYERSNLYFITSNSELYCISKSEEPFEYAENVDDDLSEDMTIFSKIKASKTVNATKQGMYQKHLFEKDVGRKTIREYLEAPLLTLPPVRLQAASILKSLILQKEVAG
ncbi:WD repeat-containing protein l(2)05287 [Rhynchophorus ferrugineus]|uniref:WD repeat-containing protein l(2)05287 n=1 Tax=Rhynchophorus ferrugineus TaxID=354439 RepID=UPI003FCD8DD9